MNGPETPWTVLSLLTWAGEYLAEKGFDETRLHAELLLAHVLGLSRLDLYLQFDRPLISGELGRFKALFRRRLAHEPLQYILGETEFMGCRLEVDSQVLIPRPETEQLVETAIGIARGTGGTGLEILDCGTGSGNIAIAMARMLPASAITACDVSPGALAVARRNAERNGTANVSFEESDLFGECLPGRSFDMIVANPPYVSAEEYAGLQAEVREFEPRIAVTDGGDGLRFIRRIARLAAERLRPGGALCMEIAWNQADSARAIVAGEGLQQVQVRPDYAGHPRILTSVRPGGGA
jgi:release factor glutamine methyltransferase